MIKILIGGSPCTFWSVAQKNNRETTAEGQGWELFKNYLIAKEKFNPDIFLYENNKSAAQAIKNQIKEELGVDNINNHYIEINSALVSAQNRQRFYVHNCPNVEQPKDRGILLKDILTSVQDEIGYEIKNIKRFPSYGQEDKSRPITAHYPNNFGGWIDRVNNPNPSKQQIDIIAEPVNVCKDGKAHTIKAQYYKNGIANFITNGGHAATAVAEPIRVGDVGSNSQAHRVYSCEGKSVTINAGGGGQGGKTGLYACPINNTKLDQPIYEVKNGLITIKDKQYPIKLADGFYIIRKLTPIECERLQTMPDNYTEGVSNAQRYKALGNGWTAEVIIHILSHALINIPKDEEIVVLSMYDGIATGRYVLDKLGFTNVTYYAYEIDKYAIQIAQKNYPDIIQCGDAFALRDNNWRLKNDNK